MRKMRIVILSGAGISAESGLRTFRDSDGLWEEYRIEDVATPQAFAKDPALVLRFYDERRKQVIEAQPNAAHLSIAQLEHDFHVDVITQNIDDLHERAGSTRVLHLHGEIRSARSSSDARYVIPIEGDSIPYGALCPMGSQLRPHIVWFGEEVPMIPFAAKLMEQADVLIVIGTSLNVYPAAGLIHYASSGCQIHVIDPQAISVQRQGVDHRNEKASLGMPKLASELKTLLTNDQ
ncbi:MAG: NAD-dependent deacylase [Flavobacteriales bacterium]|nr:NAD-dependent deacylase [Flavobacteriales bacterium]